VKKENAAIPQVCVKWEQFPKSVSTWEDWNVLMERFPVAASWGQATT
jgi:hypothetical protein